ncbi:hypothetical protein MXB_252, partial [Myxobolus squamalis]
MVWDVKNTALFYYTSSHIFGCTIWEEDRNIWKLLLDKSDFEGALKLTENNPKNNDLVNQYIAASYIEKKELKSLIYLRYMKAAEIYAKTNSHFESTIMQFVELDSKYLIEYLTIKLPFYQNNPIQKHLIIMWIIDMYLIGLCRHHNNGDINSSFAKFLRIPLVKKCIETYPSVYYKVIEHYGNGEFLVYTARLLMDYEKIINYHLSHNEYFDAFEKLKNQNRPELWYKLSYKFFLIMPKEVIECWKNLSNILDPKRLVQGIIHINLSHKPELMQHFIEYLKYAIETLKIEHLFIHNYLISLYCSSNRYQSILNYLEKFSDPICYDKYYVLQLCFQHKIHKACTFILCTMGLYEEAVDLALTVFFITIMKVDVEHSKECANRAPDATTKRKLWLIIASNTITKQMDVDTATKFLNEAVVLKFEDLLPFFGDFNKIDTFKDAICQSLQSYGSLVEKQKFEIETATNKGIVFGPLLIFVDNIPFDCSTHTVPIPDYTKINNVETNANYVFLLEKETIFDRLRQKRFFSKHEAVVLITARGMPDINTRGFLNTLNDKLSIPILSLMDPDPYGIHIYMVYKYGSK